MLPMDLADPLASIDEASLDTKTAAPAVDDVIAKDKQSEDKTEGGAMSESAERPEQEGARSIEVVGRDKAFLCMEARGHSDKITVPLRKAPCVPSLLCDLSIPGAPMVART